MHECEVYYILFIRCATIISKVKETSSSSKFPPPKFWMIITNGTSKSLSTKMEVTYISDKSILLYLSSFFTYIVIPKKTFSLLFALVTRIISIIPIIYSMI